MPNTLNKTNFNPVHISEPEFHLLFTLKHKGFNANQIELLAEAFKHLKPVESPQMTAQLITWTLSQPAIMEELRQRYMDYTKRDKYSYDNGNNLF